MQVTLQPSAFRRRARGLELLSPMSMNASRNGRAPRWRLQVTVLALAAASAARGESGDATASVVLTEAARERARERGDTGRTARQPAGAQVGKPYKGYGPAALEILGF